MGDNESTTTIKTQNATSSIPAWFEYRSFVVPKKLPRYPLEKNAIHMGKFAKSIYQLTWGTYVRLRLLQQK